MSPRDDRGAAPAAASALGWPLILLLGAIAALGPLGIDTTLPAFPAMAAGLGTDADAIRASLGAMFLGIAAGQLLHGPLSDRFGRRPVLLAGLLGFALAAAGCAASVSVEMLSGFRAVLGFAAASGQIVVRALIRDLFDREEGARRQTYVLAVHGLMPIVAPVVGAHVAAWLGWRAVFAMIAAAGCALALVFARSVGETLADELRRPLHLGQLVRSAGRVLQSPVYRANFLVGVGMFTSIYIFLTNAPQVFIVFFGVSTEGFGYAFSATMLGLVAARLLGSRLIGRLATPRLLAGACAVTAAGGLAMAALALAGVDRPMAVVGPMFLVCAGMAIVQPLTIAGALQPFHDLAGTASSLFGFLQITIATLCGVVIGLLDRGDQLHMTTAIGLATLFSFAVAAILLRRAR